MYLAKKTLAKTRKRLNGLNEYLFEPVLHKSVLQQVPQRRQRLSPNDKKSCNTAVAETDVAALPKSICAVVD